MSLGLVFVIPLNNLPEGWVVTVAVVPQFGLLLAQVAATIRPLSLTLSGGARGFGIADAIRLPIPSLEKVFAVSYPLLFGIIMRILDHWLDDCWRFLGNCRSMERRSQEKTSGFSISR